MKVIYILIFVFQSFITLGQKFEWLPSNHYTVRPEGIQLGDLMVSKTHRVVLYFKNRTGHAVEMDSIRQIDRSLSKMEPFLHIEKIIYPKYELAENAVDSIVLEFTTAPLIQNNDIGFSVGLKWNPKTRIYDSPDFYLQFRSVPPVSPNAQIDLLKYYDVGKITLSNHMLPIPLQYSNKGTEPLVATLFKNRADAKKGNLVGKLLPAGKFSSFDYETEHFLPGTFQDTLYVLTNGSDSVHSIMVRGEILQIVGNQAILKLLTKPSTGDYDIGSVLQGEEPLFQIKIRNIGNMPLIIKNVMTASNCIATYTTTPMMPNEDGLIEFKQDASRVRTFHSSMRVIIIGVEKELILSMKGRIVAPHKQ